MYKMIIISEDIENLQKVLDRLEECVAENAVKINPIKCKVFRFTRARVEDPLLYTLGDQLILEASSCNYLGTILRSELSWADHVNLTVNKAWKAIHFTMRVPKRGNSCTIRLAHTTPVGSILENGAAYLEPYNERQIHALDRVQKKAAKFAHYTNESNWETWSQRTKISRICVLFKAYSGERVWKAICDRIQWRNHLSST